MAVIVRGTDVAHARVRLSQAVEHVLQAELRTAWTDEARQAAEEGAKMVRQRLKDVEVVRADLRDQSVQFRQIPAVAQVGWEGDYVFFSNQYIGLTV